MSDQTQETQASQEDALSIRVEKQAREIDTLKDRCASLERGIEQILKIMQKSEELFELRSSRVLHNLFSGLCHNLEHSIEHAQHELRLENQGFDIQVVNGVTVKESANTILVVKKEEGQYDFSPAGDPENVMNEGTEPFVDYFEKNPQVFGDKTELLVNIIALAAPAKAEVPV